MFIGEAKQSETPADFKAIGRIENYMRWLSRRPRNSLFCVCHPVHHGSVWLPTLESIADAVELDRLTGGTATVSYEAAITWLLCSGRGWRIRPSDIGGQSDIRRIGGLSHDTLRVRERGH